MRGRLAMALAILSVTPVAAVAAPAATAPKPSLPAAKAADVRKSLSLTTETVALTPRAMPDAELTTDTDVRLAEWVKRTGDNNGLPFIIIDKIGAKVFVYDKAGVLLGSTAALIGSAKGDDSTPGVGDRELSDIAPAERTTPAGRFLAAYGPSVSGERVFWVDYDTAISLHPVVTTKPQERRLERLRSPTVADNRITFGCINVSTAFYEEVVRKTFAKSQGVVYILPEVRSLATVFPAFEFQMAASNNGKRSSLGPPP